MPRINKSLPLAAFLVAGARAQFSTSSVVINTTDTAVTTVTYSTCPSITASVTTITNPHMSTYTGGSAARPGDMTTYVTVCHSFCTGGPENHSGLCPTTHTVTATCPCYKATPGGMGPGMTETVAVCPTCGPGGSPMTATIMTPMPGATGGAAPAPAPAGSPPPAGAAPGAPGASAPPMMGGSPPAAGGSMPGSSMPGGSMPGGSMPGMGAAGPGAAAPSGAGANYGNGSSISPAITPAQFRGTASRVPLVGGLLSTVAGLSALLAFIL